jgi:CarD family transcriptional regulator
MFKVNDYVVYNSTGVYKILDIRKENDIDNHEIDYYVLQPAFTKNMIVKTPVNNPKVIMRSVMSKEEVLALIASMPEKEAVWINDDRERAEIFKTALKTGESEKWVKLIKTIHLRKQEVSELGKKLLKTDENILIAAERNLNEEFAFALNISPDEVVPYILEQIPS